MIYETIQSNFTNKVAIKTIAKKIISKNQKTYKNNLTYWIKEKLPKATDDEIEDAFKSKKLHPLDLKKAVAAEINSLLLPFQKNREELKKLADESYPKL